MLTSRQKPPFGIVSYSNKVYKVAIAFATELKLYSFYCLSPRSTENFTCQSSPGVPGPSPFLLSLTSQHPKKHLPRTASGPTKLSALYLCNAYKNWAFIPVKYFKINYISFPHLENTICQHTKKSIIKIEK